jgi:hypothetical protein
MMDDDLKHGAVIVRLGGLLGVKHTDLKALKSTSSKTEH